jgi:hypothetical protein
MWHVCEAALAAHTDWLYALEEHTKKEAKKYQSQSSTIVHWYEICKRQFPVYVEYWRKNPDVRGRTPVAQEISFKTPYTLPSGREILLRGKFDSIDVISRKLYLQENKTKSEINEEKIKKQLTFDLQTMMYILALDSIKGDLDLKQVIGGVRYNTIVRPLSGGKNSIRQHKGRMTKKGLVGAETEREFFDRLAKLIADEPGFFFKRFSVDLSAEDLWNFQNKCFNPLMEEVCTWYDWVTNGDPYREGNFVHYRAPYGVYNPLMEGRSTDMDEYLDNGSMVGLVKIERLFTELDNA